MSRTGKFEKSLTEIQANDAEFCLNYGRFPALIAEWDKEPPRLGMVIAPSSSWRNKETYYLGR